MDSLSASVGMVQATAPVLAASVAGAGTKDAQKLANKSAKELAEYQFDKNLEMWNMTNDYNSPYSQMERLRYAGLNPNLVYGSGNVGGNAASTPPSYERPNVIPEDGMSQYIFQGIQASMDNQMRMMDLDSRIRNVDADTDIKRLEADIRRYTVDTQYLDFLSRVKDVVGKDLDNEGKSKLNSWIDSEKGAFVRNLLANARNTDSIVDYRDNYEVPNIESVTDRNRAETAFIRGPRTRVANAQIDSLSSQAAATRWNTLRSQSMFAVDLQSAINKNIIDEKTALKLDSELNYVRARTRNMSADTILKYKDAIIRQWQIDYGLPFGLLNDYFNTAIGGAKLFK